MPRELTKCLFLQAFVMLCPRTSAAQPPPPHREHVRFSYDAPEGCPTKDEFEARVRDRAAEIIEDPEAARTMTVTIDQRERWHGTLRTEGIANGEGAREIDGHSCERVARSMAIFTAIALREGLTDELPPAHPELQEKNKPEPTEGGLPMAPPLRVPAVTDLHRGRVAFTATESLSIVNDGGRQIGTGLGIDYFIDDWLAFGIEGAALLDLPSDLGHGNDADQARARLLTRVELETIRARGSLFGSNRGRALDQFFTIGAGAIFVRPRPETAGFLANPYSANFLLDLGTGLRVFTDDDVAFAIQADAMIYSDPQLETSPFDPNQARSVSALAAAGVIQLGFTWFPSPARKWDE